MTPQRLFGTFWDFMRLLKEIFRLVLTFSEPNPEPETETQPNTESKTKTQPLAEKKVKKCLKNLWKVSKRTLKSAKSMRVSQSSPKILWICIKTDKVWIISRSVGYPFGTNGSSTQSASWPICWPNLQRTSFALQNGKWRCRSHLKCSIYQVDCISTENNHI